MAAKRNPMICPYCGGHRSRMDGVMCVGHDWDEIYLAQKAEIDQAKILLGAVLSDVPRIRTSGDPSRLKSIREARKFVN